MIYSGIGINTYKFNNFPVLATINPGVFIPDKTHIKEEKAEIISVELSLTKPRLTIESEENKAGRGDRLNDAPVIVDIGLGFKEKDDIKIAEELASLLDGKVTCSRPVSSDKGWFPIWVGLSGDKVSPELCFTIGTSGAIQHVIGIRGSKIIVAVNNDENAAIFSQSDYGVLADLYTFIPALIKQITNKSYHLQSR